MRSTDTGEDERSKKMAEALLKGWKMLSETCPVCGTPLFKKPSGEVVCPVCGTRVILVSSDEEGRLEKMRLILTDVMEDLVRSLEEEVLGLREGGERSLDRINKILEALERLVRINNELGSRSSQT